MNRVVESMTRVVTNLGVVRVWRTIDGARHVDGLELLGERAWGSERELGEAIEKFSDVAAYEILDGDGNGVVVYPDWN